MEFEFGEQNFHCVWCEVFDFIRVFLLKNMTTLHKDATSAVNVLHGELRNGKLQSRFAFYSVKKV